MASKISWTDKTWNPVVGCTKVSAGCANCYAERMALRLAAMECAELEKHLNQQPARNRLVKYTPVVDFKNKCWNSKVHCLPSVLDKPLHWRKPRKIFVCSMSDLFHPKVPFEFIDKIWDIINICRQHTFQILTKRPERVLEYVKHIERFRFHSNIHLGVTCENQAMADERIPILLQVPAAVRFVSIEPMLEPIDLKLKHWVCSQCGDWTDGEILDDDNHCSCDLYVEERLKNELDWVIVGCESGPKRRPYKLEWVRDIVQQCKAANVPVFVKQLEINGKVEHNISKFPKDLQIQERR